MGMRPDESTKHFAQDVRDVAFELLDEATEDSVGLWEAPSTARKLFPDRDSEQQHAIAKQAVRDLLDEQLITFYWRSDAAPSENIGREEAARQLEQARWWQIPQSSDASKNWYEIDWLWFRATDKGQKERDRQARMRFTPGGEPDPTRSR
jgi:hypothetical protein